MRGQRLVINQSQPEDAGSQKSAPPQPERAVGVRQRRLRSLAGNRAVHHLPDNMAVVVAWYAFQARRISQPSSRVRLIKDGQNKTGLGRQVVCCKTTIKKGSQCHCRLTVKWENDENGIDRTFDLYRQVTEAVDQAVDKLDYRYTSMLSTTGAHPILHNG